MNATPGLPQFRSVEGNVQQFERVTPAVEITYPILLIEPVMSIVIARASESEKRSLLLAAIYSNGELDRCAAL